MGFLAPGSAHARPSFSPPSTLEEIFGASVWGGGVCIEELTTMAHFEFFFTTPLPGPGVDKKRWSDRVKASIICSYFCYGAGNRPPIYLGDKNALQ